MSTGSGPGNDAGNDQLKNMAVTEAGETSLPSDRCIPGTDGHMVCSVDKLKDFTYMLVW